MLAFCPRLSLAVLNCVNISLCQSCLLCPLVHVNRSAPHSELSPFSYHLRVCFPGHLMCGVCLGGVWNPRSNGHIWIRVSVSWLVKRSPALWEVEQGRCWLALPLSLLKPDRGDLGCYKQSRGHSGNELIITRTTGWVAIAGYQPFGERQCKPKTD